MPSLYKLLAAWQAAGRWASSATPDELLHRGSGNRAESRVGERRSVRPHERPADRPDAAQEVADRLWIGHNPAHDVIRPEDLNYKIQDAEGCEVALYSAVSAEW